MSTRRTVYLDERPVRRKKRKKKTGKMLVWLFVLAVFVLAILVLLNVIPSLLVKKDVTIEAGDAIPGVSIFVNGGEGQAKLLTEIPAEPLPVGEYPVEIRLLGKKITSTLHVEDTVAPMFQVQDVEIVYGTEISPEDFVTKIVDATECKVQFQEQPDFTQAGTQNVRLVVTDAGNNFAMDRATLTIISDTTPPVITGVQEQTITVGDSVSYKKGVEVTDDMDTSVSLEIDNSAVDTGRIGDYKVVYSATDKAGNTTVVETVLHVKPKEKKADEQATITAEYVEAEADRILYKIINSDMTQYEIIRAIYDWCHEKVAYSDGASKNDWVQGAYDGLVNRKGDCYTYAMTAKVLLTRAGITNKDIEKIPTPTTMHYWNLVDIGEGWHHFDTCRRADGSTFFYKTDAELMEYSNSHKGTHNYDRTIYTDIP